MMHIGAPMAAISSACCSTLASDCCHAHVLAPIPELLLLCLVPGTALFAAHPTDATLLVSP